MWCECSYVTSAFGHFSPTHPLIRTRANSVKWKGTRRQLKNETMYSILPLFWIRWSKPQMEKHLSSQSYEPKIESEMKRGTVHWGNKGENKHADDPEAGEKVCVGRGFSDVKQWGSFDLNRCSYIWYVIGIHHGFSSYHYYLWLWVGQNLWFVWQSVIWKPIKPSESERCSIFIPPLEQCPQDYYMFKKTH